MNFRSALCGCVLAASLLCGEAARAATCDVNNCSAQIQAATGVVVNDVFRDASGHDAFSLPVYGRLFNQWQGCAQEVVAACAGQSSAPYDCPGQYACASPAPTFDNASQYLNALDHLWWQPCRLANGDLLDQGGGRLCPQFSCIVDGVGGNYLPWEGLVFDLGAPSNKAAIFASNDRGPQPCESLEYTVFLSDNPHATAQVLDPATQGVDPGKWNRAVLSRIYTGGTLSTRAPDPAGHSVSCGDTALFSVEDDSFVQEFSLPCGVTLRYASVVAGNDGRDFPGCAFDTSTAELDAVTGLTADGVAVCPDSDQDRYVDCSCPGAPTVCDCNDSDPSVHPGAPETCDATVDRNCDGLLGTACAAGTVCHQSECLPQCTLGSDVPCTAGSACTATSVGHLCVPDQCGCQPGEACINAHCVNACLHVVCPGVMVCQDGHCVDPCANAVCASGAQCHGGQCVGPCGCFAGSLGCPSVGTVCDRAGGNQCVTPSCVGVSCMANQTCNPASGLCDGLCNAGVVCPQGQRCEAPTGCVPLCTGVTCSGPLTCDPWTGQCSDPLCRQVTCQAPQTCSNGVCVDPPASSSSGAQATSSAGGSSTARASSSVASTSNSANSSRAGSSHAASGTTGALSSASMGTSEASASGGHAGSQGSGVTATSTSEGGGEGGARPCGCVAAAAPGGIPGEATLLAGVLALALRRRRR